MRAELYQVALPLRRPFAHAATARSATASVVLALYHGGVTALGEGAPRAYVTGESTTSVVAALLQLDLAAAVEEIDFSDAPAALSSLARLAEKHRGTAANVWCTLEMALLDLIGQWFGVPVAKLIAAMQGKAASEVALTKQPTSQVLDLSLRVADFVQGYGPFHFVKVKVTTDLHKNLARLQALRAGIGPHVPISVDPNMAWSYAQAVANIRAFAGLGVAYYEEPLARGALDSLAKLRGETGVRIMLDESACTRGDLLRAVTAGACDAVNVRLAKCGGVARALALVDAARAAKVGFQLGAQVAEVGPLVAAGRHFIAAVPGSITYEAGQPDRLFREFLVTPMPLVDRQTNCAPPLHAAGLGIGLRQPADLNGCSRVGTFADRRWRD